MTHEHGLLSSSLLILILSGLTVACGSSTTSSTGADTGTDGGRRDLDAPPDGPEAGRDGHTDANATDASIDAPAVTLLAGKPGGQGNLDGVTSGARTYLPSLIADDGAGHLYFTDRNGVRALDVTTGALTTLAGSVLSPPFVKDSNSSCNFSTAESIDGTGAAARFNGPLGVALDGAGSLYVADSCNNTLRKIDIATMKVTTYLGTAGTPGSTDGDSASALFSLPSGVVYDGAGYLYVTDDADRKLLHAFGGDTIRMVDLATSVVSTIAGSPGANGSTDGAGSAALFDGPAGLAYANGFLYVADGNNSTIRQVDVKTGNVVTVAGTAGNAAFADGVGASAAFNVPVGVVYDGAGFLYVTDSGNAALRKIALSNFNVTTIAGTPGTAGDSDGKGEAGTFAVPFGLVYDSASALYLTDQTYEVSVSLPPVGGSTLRKIDPATAAVSTLAGAPPVFGSTNGAGAEATFDLQFGDLAYDGSGNLYVADTGNAVVRKVDLMTGAVSTLAGLAGQSGHTDGSSHVAQFVFPSFLAYDGAGELYVSDQLCNDASPQVCAASPTIRAVDTATGAVSTVATLPWGGTTFSNPNGLAYDGAGHLFVADDLAEAILVVDVSTGTFSTLAGSGQTGFADGTGTAATFEFPYGLAYDGKANLFVTDWDVSTVRRVVVATGAVTTFAGTHFMTGSADGVGPAALFNEPQGISYDGAGHLYVADAPLLGGTSPPGGSTLRRIDVSTAEVTTVAGSPGAQGVRLGPLAMARFNNPAGVVANGSHGLFVSDIGENVVLQVLLPP